MRFRSLEIDPWLAATVVVSLILGCFHLGWGLPAQQHSWAVDGLEPLDVLGIVKKSFRPLNSGYFYFKYPPAYPFSVAAFFSPYLAYAFVTGGLSAGAAGSGAQVAPHVLYVLGLIGRSFSVLAAVGTVCACYGVTRRLCGIEAARWAAWLVATCYPLVFYAHTMNVDASYLCWIFVALYFAVAASETDRVWEWAALGAAAAMAVSTKEQAFGFLLPLPLLALATRARAHATAALLWRRPALAMMAAAIVTALVANNVLLNPYGFVARIAYLLGHPITRVTAPLKPVSFAWFKGGLEITYLGQFWDGLTSALGIPLALLAVAGALELLLQRRRATAWLLLPALGYYYLSLRGQQLITMRYSLPAILLLVLVAAALMARLRTAASGTPRQIVTAAFCLLALFSLARGVELDLLLANDSRYRAEEWMAANLPSGARGDAYQKPTYLPRAPHGMSMISVPPEGRSVAGLESREPDFIVLSSESRKSVTHVWNPDWRQSGELLVPLPEAQQLIRALSAGTLPYRRAAVFDQQPRLIRSRITGLAPEITIWVRSDGHE